MTATALNTKSSEVENKILDTSCLFTTVALNTKISEIENKNPDNSKYIGTKEYNKLTTENFPSKADLMNKTDFDNKLTSFNKRMHNNKQNILNFIEN